MESFLQDLRFSFRTLLRNPAFTATAVTVLALGVAATSAITSVVIAVLVHQLPYPDQDRLLVFASFREDQGAREAFPSSYLDYKDWKAHCASFEDVGVYSSIPYAFNLLTGGAPERITGEIVDSAYFRLLRIQPVLGRTLTAQDDSKRGEPAVAVLGHGLWQRRFGRDPRILGQSILLDGRSYQVVGVMPARFRGLTDEAEVWLPVTMGNQIFGDPRYLDQRRVRWLAGMARLKPNVSLAQAQSEMNRIDTSLAKEFPDADEHMGVDLKTLKDSLVGDLRFPLLTLLGASLFVLLIAWTTVATLLLARAAARRRELAVRDALGATQRRLMRQLLTESLVLAGTSCAAGLLASFWCTGLLVRLSAVKFQSFVAIGLNPLVVAVVILLSLGCGVAFGLTPGWLSIRSGFGTLRASSGGGGSRHRLQSCLVVAEVALALFLLTGAALLIKGFQHAREAPLGFAPGNLLAVRVDLKDKRYAATRVMTQVARQYRDRLSAIPGVKTAALEGPGMPTDPWVGASFIVEDLIPKTKKGIAYLVFHHVSPGYFQQLGIPLTQGRDFTDADTDTTPLAIVISQAMVRKYWPHESPLGKRMRFGTRDPNAPWHTVVGVVGDLNQRALQASEWPGPDVYFDLFQFPPLLTPQINALIRTRGGVPPGLVERVEGELRAVAPEAPPFDPDTIENRLNQFAAKDRFLVLLMSVFALLALVLAAMGLYGVLFFSVTQRTRELGVRLALGAQTRDVLRLVVGKAAALAASGLGLGLVAAVVLNRLFQSLLFGVSPTDVPTYLASSLVLFLVAMVAAVVPARRALRIQPTIALRTD